MGEHWNEDVWRRFGDNISNLSSICSPSSNQEKTMAAVIFFITCIGWVANIINILIFSHKSMRSVMINWYLIGLSISDFIGLWCTLLFISLPALVEIDALNIVNLSSFAQTASAIGYPLGRLFQCISIYLTVCVSAHRFLTVCYPFKGGRICTKRNVLLVIGGVIASSFAFVFCTFFDVRLTECYHATLGRWINQVYGTALRNDAIYIQIYHTWLFAFVLLIIPFTLLIVMNIRVIAAVHASRLRHATLSISIDASNSDEAKKERSTTIMLIGVVVVFLLCNFLSLIASLFELMKNMNLNVGHEYTIIVPYSNMMVCISQSVYIFIYLTFSQRYRKLLRFYAGCYAFRNSESGRHLLESHNTAHV